MMNGGHLDQSPSTWTGGLAGLAGWLGSLLARRADTTVRSAVSTEHWTQARWHNSSIHAQLKCVRRNTRHVTQLMFAARSRERGSLLQRLSLPPPSTPTFSMPTLLAPVRPSVCFRASQRHNDCCVRAASILTACIQPSLGARLYNRTCLSSWLPSSTCAY